MAPRKHQELMTAAVASDGEGQRALIAGDARAARTAFARAAELYRQSWEAAPRTAYGRLVGMLKSAVLAGGGEEEARYAQRALADAGAESKSPTAAYALALAALVLGEDEAAGGWAARMTSGSEARLAAGSEGRMAAASEAFVRAGATVAALAAGDSKRYDSALTAIVRDFEERTEHLTGVAVADTALVLAELGSRRGMGVSIDSPVLPRMSAL